MLKDSGSAVKANGKAVKAVPCLRSAAQRPMIGRQMMFGV